MLTFRALVEVFTMGGFSKEISKELNQVENQGIKGFVIAMFMFGYRLKKFMKGIVDGVMPFMNMIRISMIPVIKEFGEAFGFLVDQIVLLLTEVGVMDKTLGKSSDKWQQAGGRTGAGIGGALQVFAVTTKIILDGFTGIVKLLGQSIMLSRLFVAVFKSVDWGAVWIIISNAWKKGVYKLELIFHTLKIAIISVLKLISKETLAVVANVIDTLAKVMMMLPSTMRPIPLGPLLVAGALISSSAVGGGPGPAPTPPTYEKERSPFDRTAISELYTGGDKKGASMISELGKSKNDPADIVAALEAAGALGEGSRDLITQKIIIELDGETLAEVLRRVQDRKKTYVGQLRDVGNPTENSGN